RARRTELLARIDELAGVGVPLDRYFLDLLLLHLRQKLGEGRLLDLVAALREEVVEGDEEDDQDDPEPDGLVSRTHVSAALSVLGGMRAAPGRTPAISIIWPTPGELPDVGPYQQQQKALNYLGVRGHPPTPLLPLYNEGVR